MSSLASIDVRHDEWGELDIGSRAERNGRQGVRYLLQDGLTVKKPPTGTMDTWTPPAAGMAFGLTLTVPLT